MAVCKMEIINTDIEHVQVDDLRLHEANPRDGDVPAIEESIRENGFYGALIVQRSSGKVLVGNHRLQAARNLGMASVPVFYVDVSEERALRILLADNRTNDLAGYNDDALAELLEHLATTDDELAGTGYDNSALDELLDDLGRTNGEHVENPGAEVDRAEELKEKWGTERGQLWQISRHRLLCGDATDEDDVGRLLDGERPSLCVTSPPYFVGKEYEQEHTEEDIIAFIDRSSYCMAEVVNPTRRIVINCSTTAWSHVVGHADYRLNLDWWQEALREHGWATRSIRVWAKHGGLLHNTPNADLVDMHWEFLATFYNPSSDYEGQNRVGEPWSTSGIWDDVGGARQDVHSAPFQEEIPKRFILLYSRQGDVVYEPFCGSGTTMVAAEHEGRICYGMELDAGYTAVILERLSAMGLTPELVNT